MDYSTLGFVYMGLGPSPAWVLGCRTRALPPRVGTGGDDPLDAGQGPCRRDWGWGPWSPYECLPGELPLPLRGC
jgi:hypothetical protein